MMAEPHRLKVLSDKWVNLADPRLGAAAIFTTDEFFAPKDRMIDPEPAAFVPGKYDDHGQWMDGWETRRKRGEGHDYCIVRLGFPGIIKSIDIDTSHFTGNYPPAASVDACNVTGDPTPSTEWHEIVPSANLGGNAQHIIPVASNDVWSYLRLNIYPDGGIARFRVYGQVVRDWSGVDRATEIDLVALENGGRPIACNDRHYGTPMNIIKPGRGVNMGDGWETRRRREPGNDWAILALGHPGQVSRILVDTAHFKGNFPDCCSIQAALVQGGTEESLTTQSMFWRTLLPEQKLRMDSEHLFEREIANLGPITHVRLNIIPDGGISRIRLFGFVA